MLIALGALSAICALCYGLYLVHQPNSALRTGVKVVPVTSLALISLLSAGPWMLTVALALGATGDLFLSRDGERAFLFGLAAFLLGHLGYVLLFVDLSGGGGLYLGQPWRILACAGLLALAIPILRRLWPHLGAMQAPVLVYVAVILAMGFAAFGLPDHGFLSLALIGALAFIASDAILGFELFVWPDTRGARRFSSTVLWFLYWSGQAMICAAILMA
ncbi:lysoplasmalogenase [Pontivivens insulae]|uniref:YhhN-like protein n=1 Tax=Pontivivens insulae TaxID=1639689 RepID=A0A2R8AAU9_9RHOB|nr:lysoplasmalogenase [Pontivivens insulae]RED13068.1 putative membrane protein YhhN [Pontivivens insulae]SPF29160.1 hypothetical protein POI8812_01467 [Pontivivens insulae]